MKKGFNYQKAVRRAALLREHKQYLNTKTWEGKRQYVLRRDNYTCVRCGIYKSNEKLHVHHKTYKRHKAEKTSDLVTLCESCHQIVHGQAGTGAGTSH